MSGLRALVAARPRRELWLLAAAIGLGLAIRVAFVLITKDHVLAGDEIEYDLQGRFFEQGQWWWSTTPYGIPHPSMFKAPLYPLWVGAIYSLFGPDPDRVLLIQAVMLAPLTIGLTWLLGLRLFGPRAALLAAAVVAVYPFVWQYETRLYSEALAIPLTMLTFLVVLEHRPTRRIALAVGALLGVALLLRPTSFVIVPGIVVAWALAVGVRPALRHTALAVGVAVLVLAPWTARNALVDGGGFVPISVQDAAAYGTFNDDAANDDTYPWAWRPVTRRDLDLIGKGAPARSDPELRSALTARAREYIVDHPSSVPKAIFWNGISRTWDLRRPARVIDESNFEGRSRKVTAAGFAIYGVLLALALVGLVRSRARRTVVLPLVAIVLASFVVFAPVGATRYRAPLEPVIALLACATVVGRGRLSDADVAPDASPAR